MILYPTERTALFIDGPNLYAATRALQADIDFRKLLNHFAARTQFIRAHYYTPIYDDSEQAALRPLINWLDYNGYRVCTRPIREHDDVKRVKAATNLDLALDAMDIAEHVDHTVLISGDGEFGRLIESLQRKGQRVTVISTLRTQPPMAAEDLRRKADQFVDLFDLLPSVARNRAD